MKVLRKHVQKVEISLLSLWLVGSHCPCRPWPCDCWMVCYTEESLKGHLPFSLCWECPWLPQKKRLRFQGICLSTYQWTGQLCLFTGPGLPWPLFTSLGRDIPWCVSWKLASPMKVHWSPLILTMTLRTPNNTLWAVCLNSAYWLRTRWNYNAGGYFQNSKIQTWK